MKNIFALLFLGFGFIVYMKEYQNKDYSYIYKDAIASMGDTTSQVVYISGLGDYDQSDLEVASKAITEMYGIECQIIDPTATTGDLYTSEGKLDAMTCSNSLNTVNKTVYVTNEYVISHDRIVCGSSTFNGNFIIVSDNFNDVKNTTIHEMAHTFGLDHCDNQCILGHIELGDPNGKFCNDCKKQLGL
jgi:hypothetical protein